MSPKLQRGAEWARIHMWLLEPMEAAFRAAVRAGVKIVTGTDTAGQYPEDVAMMREFGLDPMESLLACTRNAAEALGLDGEIGTVEAGKVADLVLLDGDPLADAEALGRIHLVVQRGVAWRPDDITLRSPV
jgi:imidazolonepropionase-like amidohydrolase